VCFNKEPNGKVLANCKEQLQKIEEFPPIKTGGEISEELDIDQVCLRKQFQYALSKDDVLKLAEYLKIVLDLGLPHAFEQVAEFFTFLSSAAYATTAELFKKSTKARFF